MRNRARQQALKDIEEDRQKPLPPGLEQHHDRLRKRYWHARQQYANHLLKHDRDLWRLLMPCDPVITVAEDVVCFECFSADESSYGCLTVDRESAFGPSDSIRFGTTNVDYSWDLYHHFQALRTYRQTRFRIDPAGFEVATAGNADYREEKIDLPHNWLRGFMQLQSAMTLPAITLGLSREAVYSILAFHKRHRARTSPRAIRFELLPGKPPELVLEPWEQRIVSHGTIYNGPPTEPIRIWGARRLLMLARLLPLVERFDVHLLGTGLPSFWIAHLGEMRLTVGLSGWTTNDWTRASALELIARPAIPPVGLVAAVADLLQHRRAISFHDICATSLGQADHLRAALRHLAHAGQVIYDLGAGLYRWRQIMPRAVGEADMGDPNPELLAARRLLEQDRFGIQSQSAGPSGSWVLCGTAGDTAVEILLDADGRIKRGTCSCSYFHRFGLKNGPCRHMLALRWMRPKEHAMK